MKRYFLLNVLMVLSCLLACESSPPKENRANNTELKVISTSPKNGEMRASIEDGIRVEFNREIAQNEQEIKRRVLVLEPENLLFDIKKDDLKSFTLVPKSPVVPGSNFRMTVGGQSGDDWIEKAYDFSFRVRLRDEVFSLEVVNPKNGETNLPIDSGVTFSLDVEPDVSTVNDNAIIVKPWLRLDWDNAQALLQNKLWTVFPKYSLRRGEKYSITFLGILSNDTSKENIPTTITFSTSPNLVLKSLECGPNSTALYLNFDESLDMATLKNAVTAFDVTTKNQITLSDEATSTAYDGRVYFTAANKFIAGQTIRVTVASTVSNREKKVTLAETKTLEVICN